MDEEPIFVPIERVVRKKKPVGNPKDTTNHHLGEQINGAPPQTSPGLPRPLPNDRTTKEGPEYYNLLETPPSPPPLKCQSPAKKPPLPSAGHGPRRSPPLASPGLPKPLPNHRTMKDGPEYYNLLETPPSPPPLKSQSPARKPPIPSPRHGPKRSASADHFRLPEPPPSAVAYNRKLSVPVHTSSQSSILAPPLPPPRNKRSTSVDHSLTQDFPLSPLLQTELATAEHNRTCKALASYLGGNPSRSLFDDAHHQFRSTTREKFSSKSAIQPLTHSAPSSSSCTSVGTLFIPTSCAMTSEEVADPQKVTLPQLFRVNNSNSTSGITEGSIILVKYTKSTSIVHGREKDGRRIQMSLNTPVTVSPITECNQRRQKMTAEEMFSLRPPPLAVKVMQPFSLRDCTIEQGTLLFLETTEGVQRNPKRLTFCDYRGNKIILTTTCTGLFSSHPDDVKVFLAELVAKFKFPVNVLFQDGKHSSKTVSLEGVCKRDSLVVQLCSKHDGKPVGWDHELLDHSGLSFVRVALNKESKQVIHSTIPESGPFISAPMPKLLPCAENASGSTPPKNSKDRAMRNADEETFSETHGGYMKMQLRSNHGAIGTSGQQHPLPKQKQMDGESNVSPGDEHSSRPDAFTASQTTSSTEKTRDDHDDSASERSRMETPVLSDDDNPNDDNGEGYLYVTIPRNVTYTTEDRNIAYLKTLNEADILQLLEAMNMNMYKPIFQREAVDGQLLSELTDEMLQNELEVKSSLHRLRFSSIIKGQRSVKDLLASGQTSK